MHTFANIRLFALFLSFCGSYSFSIHVLLSLSPSAALFSSCCPYTSHPTPSSRIFVRMEIRGTKNSNTSPFEFASTQFKCSQMKIFQNNFHSKLQLNSFHINFVFLTFTRTPLRSSPSFSHISRLHPLSHQVLF